MKLGMITGQIVATKKSEQLTGCKLMLVQPVRPDGKPSGDVILAVDTVGAGVGETVFYAQGSVASRAMRDQTAPVDTAITGIVDRIDLYGREKR